ncbi:MAG: DUF1700 domain-containing protein [Lachnospiraceae bacterium]|nr:DUF1700 domain-containing protein [Lachnospiraceae bacterium]
MNRSEYMRELAYLLQDVPDGEREEALQYYEDYFDDAGPEQEDQVIMELGRPEKLAAIIREGARNGYESPDAEYTENGYQNERYRGPRCEVIPPEQVERKQIGDGSGPENDSGEYGWEWGTRSGKDAGNYKGTGNYGGTEEETWGNRARSVFEELGQRISEGAHEGRRRMEESRQRRRREQESQWTDDGRTGGQTDGETGQNGQTENSAGADGQTCENSAYGRSYGSPNAPVRRRRNPFIWLLFLMALLFLSPLLLGVAAMAFGFSLMVICGAGGIALAVIIIAVAFVATGVILFGLGIGKLFVFPLAGMMFMGAGLVLFSLGILAVWLAVMVCGKLIPGVIRMIGNMFSFFGRRRRGGTAA